MTTDKRQKLPVQGILMQLAGCHNPHLIETVVNLVLTDGRYSHEEFETIQRYAKARVEFMRGRL